MPTDELINEDIYEQVFDYLLENSKPIDPEIGKYINENFWAFI